MNIWKSERFTALVIYEELLLEELLGESPYQHDIQEVDPARSLR